MSGSGSTARGWVAVELAREARAAGAAVEASTGSARELDPKAASAWAIYLSRLPRIRRMRSMPARETAAVAIGATSCVVKETRGDPFRERWYERLRARAARSPAQREADVLQALAADGFDVPGVLGWMQHGDRGTLVLEHVEHLEDLAQRLTRAPHRERAALLERLASLVARLHRRGFYHRDLYLTHVVVRRADDAFVLLDLGRARRERRPRSRWFVKDLAALLLSRPPVVSRTEALRCLRQYLHLGGFGGPDARRVLRAWARRVVAKERRLAAHVPRYVDPGTVRPPGVPAPSVEAPC